MEKTCDDSGFRWFITIAVAGLGLWIGWQQLKIAELQNSEQRQRQAEEDKERSRHKVRVSSQGDVVRIQIVRIDPVTKVETTEEIITSQAGWKELEDELQRKSRPPVPKNRAEAK